MKAHDRASSLFWLLFSVYVCIESLRMGPGTLKNPGMGFMTFGASSILGLLSLALFSQSFSKRERTETESFFMGRGWRGMILVLMALLLYTKLLPLLGYLISTFSLMCFLFWIVERKKVWQVLVLSITITAVTYFVFSKWLNVQFPYGLLRF